MRRVPEYDIQNPATWVIIRERDVWSESEAAEFQHELVRIADLNPFGEPNLVIRWGVAYEDPQMPDGKPKYYLSSNEPTLSGHQYRDDSGEMVTVKHLEDVPVHKLSLPLYSETHLGERRFIVEQWRSAEFLKRTGRYQQTHYTDGQTIISCRNCGGEMRETGRGDERVCRSCGSKRQSIVEHREVFTEKLLNDLPERGCYDFFMRLEKNGVMQVADAQALCEIADEWEARKKPFEEKNRIRLERRANQEKDKAYRKNEIWQAV